MGQLKSCCFNTDSEQIKEEDYEEMVVTDNYNEQ